METTTAERSTVSEGEAAMELQEQGRPLIPQEEEQPLIPEEKKKMRLLVTVDESDASFYTLKWVLENFFKNSSDGETADDEVDDHDHHLIVMHVKPRFPQYLFPGAPVALPAVSIAESATKVQTENAEALLSQAAEICKEKKVPTEIIILEGDPKETICQAVEQMQVDLLVVASRGLGKIKRALLGSVSDYCAHHAKCPVLIVKPPKESQK